jgi:molybdopterin-guanine dinucleotide biosynthesis protein
MRIAMQRILIVDGFKRKEREKIHIEHSENAMQKTKRERYLGTNG